MRTLRTVIHLSAVVTASLALLVSAQRANACSPPQPEALRLLGSDLPAGGFLGGVFLPCVSCADAIEVRNAGGEVVPGELELRSIGGQPGFTWHATNKLVPKAQYKVTRIGSDQNYATPTFIAQPAENGTPSVSAELSVATGPAGAWFKCLEYSGSVGGFCSLPSFSFEQVRLPALVISIAGGNASQYSYEAVFTQDESLAAEHPLVTATGTSHVFEEVAKQACYRVTATPLNGKSQPLVIGEDCLATNTLRGLGRAQEPFGDVENTLQSCLQPDEDSMDAWCAHYQPAIDSGSCDKFALEACESALKICPKVSPEADAGNAQPDTTTPSDAGATVPGKTPLKDPDDAGTDTKNSGGGEVTGSSSKGDGCSVALHPRSSSGSTSGVALALLALAVGLGQRRVRRLG